jgi:hypothetical protein
MQNEAFNLGVALACVSHNLPMTSFPKLAGVAAKMQSAEAIPAKRLLIKSAHDVMVLCGTGHTAPARHLEILADLPGWSTHAEDVYHDLVKACALSETLEKHAFNEAVEGAGNLAKGIGYAGVLGGAGLGSLYWMLSRHATQNEADVEAKKRQLQYYQHLNHELQDSLRRKYRYSNATEPGVQV